MPEGRMIKKCISDSKSLGILSSDSTRLLYTWLIPHLDVDGRHSADPEIIKGHVFPKVKTMTPKKIQKLLYELAQNELIILYQNNAEFFLEFKKFLEYQKLDPKKEARSKILSPSDNSSLILENLGITQSNSPISKVKESKVKEREESLCLKKISDEDRRLTQLLIDLILKNDPKSSIIKRLSEKRQLEWLDACRKLREIDGRNPDEIESIIKFSQQDAFWKSNILSMPKLREKFGQLFLKAKKERYSGIREWLSEMEKKNDTK